MNFRVVLYEPIHPDMEQLLRNVAQVSLVDSYDEDCLVEAVSSVDAVIL